MADAIVSVVLEQLTSLIFEEMQQGVQLVTGVEKEIEKLTSNFQAIQAVLLDAEQRQVKEKAVGVWLDRLKGASYDMEDILDEWKTALSKLQIEGAEDAAVPKMVCFLFCSPRFCFKQVGLHRNIALKIKKMNEKVDEIARQKDRYHFDIIRSTEEPRRLKSTAFVDLSEIRGREEEKTKLVSGLLSDCHEEGEGLQIISIVGMGGIGKITLAQLAYNDERIMSKFEKRIWVCVSDPFDEIRIAKAIIEALEGEATSLVELQSLLDRIRRSIANKRFFLVLDDVWTEDYDIWGPFYGSLNGGLYGSKIVVTTRKMNVARMMKSIDVISVENLSEEESWSLFIQLAFRDRSLENCERLEKCGKEIVGKCKGLPLAVKAIGSLLRFKEMEQQWQMISNSELWDLKELEEGVFAPLLLSYNNLSSTVKQCFSYCAIFPKDYVMDKDELIRLWMVQGYFALKRNEEMWMIGEECFNNLAMHSFFQEFRKNGDGNILSCKMHDIVHDFAQYTNKHECLSLTINSHDASSTDSSYRNARHLMLELNVENAPFFRKRNFRKLRSLFVNGMSVDDDFLTNLIKQMRCLRVLTLRLNRHRCRIEMVPEEIGQLIHLRYLNFSSLPIRELPEMLCDLYNLETLNIRDCYNLETLPQGIGKLINLKHLLNSGTLYLSYLPKGIESLACLQALDKVVVGGDSDGSEVCTLACLRKLNSLRGSLKITRLGNVNNESEARKAEFKNKNNLMRLELDFRGSRRASSCTGEMQKDAAVLLEALQAPNLLKLRIRGYQGNTMSFDWRESLTQLKELSIEVWDRCEHLPPLGKLPLLESLYLSRMRRLKSVGNEFLGISSSSNIAFPKLKSLSFMGMEEWEKWDYDIARTGVDMKIMPLLSYLAIYVCPKLKKLPDQLLHATLPSTLEIDVSQDCGFMDWLESSNFQVIP